MRSAVGRFLPGIPLVVRQRIASVSARRASTTWPNASMSCAPCPLASRTWMWRTAAPARQAVMPSAAISDGVIGMAGYCSLVIRDPVSAAVMMTETYLNGHSSSFSGALL